MLPAYSGVRLPGLLTHTQVYEALGLDVDVCGKVDELVDVEPPLVSEVFPGELPGERLWRNFGYRRSEFPFMFRYVYGRFGSEGVRCLVAHFVLDHLENVLRRGFDEEMALNEVKALVLSYIEGCNSAGCWEVIVEGELPLRGILELIVGRFSSVVATVGGEVGLKYTEVDIIVNASSDLISFAVKATLIARGYRGRSGFSVSREVSEKYFGRIRTKSKLLLRQKLYEAFVNRVLADPQSLINSLNNVKKRVAERERVTVVEYLTIVKEEVSKNREFKKLLELVDQSVEEAVSSTLSSKE